MERRDFIASAALASACALALLGALGAARALLDHVVPLAALAALVVAVRSASRVPSP